MRLKMDWISKNFEGVDDPRAGNISQPLNNILFISICAAVSGFLSLREIVLFAEEKKEWLDNFIDLSNGLPSFKTIGRVLSAVDSQQLFKAYVKFLKPLDDKASIHIAIDGKTLRRSHDGAKNALHLVNAWATENGVILGQIPTSEKSNEITAIPEILRLINCKGNVISIDAMGCQREICKEIMDKKGYYLLALKGNQSSMHEDVQELLKNKNTSNLLPGCSVYSTSNKSHGRNELREYFFTNCIAKLNRKHEWPGLLSVGMVKTTVISNKKKSIETRYFLSNQRKNAEYHAKIIRDHWSIENNLHWMLDVNFNEDQSRVRTGNAAENFALIRHIALNILKQDTTAKVGVKNKRLKAGWSEAYLMILLKNSIF